MTTPTTTLKGITAASSLVILLACGGAPESEVYGTDAGDQTDAGDPTDDLTTYPTDSDTAADLVPWSRLPDADRIGPARSNPYTGCTTVDTLLPC